MHWWQPHQKMQTPINLLSYNFIGYFMSLRAMVFPDYYFFAERRLVNHTIETRKVKNFDDCELLCYLNDNCASLNFKKDPDNNEPVHICELNNATHLKYDSDLTTDGNFYYRGSKVSYKSIFGNFRLGIT